MSMLLLIQYSSSQPALGEREDSHERKSNGIFKNLGLLFSFLSGGALNKIPTYDVAVVSNPSLCNVCVCVFIDTMFGEIKLFVVP